MSEETESLTSEQKAALRERVARLKSPEEIAEQMAELREAVIVTSSVRQYLVVQLFCD